MFYLWMTNTVKVEGDEFSRNYNVSTKQGKYQNQLGNVITIILCTQVQEKMNRII